jgi:aspartate aminotransferase
MIKAFKERHTFVVDSLNKMNGISCLPSQGAFYSFPNCAEAIASMEGVNNDVEFAEYMITNIGVAMVPGSAFGAPGYMRLSFATSMENLQEALHRVSKLLS